MNPFLDKETQSYCTYCFATLGEFHKDGCKNNPFAYPGAAQKLLAWKPTKKDLKREEAISVLRKVKKLPKL